MSGVWDLSSKISFKGFPGCGVSRTEEGAMLRDCGYQCPWGILHSSCIIYTLSAILIHFGIVSVNFNTTIEIVSVKLLALLFTIVLVSGLSVSLVDPKHYLLRYKIPIHTQVDIDPARYLCHRCNLLRQREDVKHCHECGKCVDGFDHHCYALNHCIGARNYWIMMLLFNNGLLLTTALLIAAVAFIYGVLARSRIMIPQFAQSKTDLASDKLICFGSPCLALIPLIVVIVYVIPTVLVLFSFGALVGAHWSLVAENSTTWQHFKERKSTPEKGKSLIMRCLLCNLFSCFTKKKKKPPTIPERNSDQVTHDRNIPGKTGSKEKLIGAEGQ